MESSSVLEQVGAFLLVGFGSFFALCVVSGLILFIFMLIRFGWPRKPSKPRTEFDLASEALALVSQEARLAEEAMKEAAVACIKQGARCVDRAMSLEGFWAARKEPIPAEDQQRIDALSAQAQALRSRVGDLKRKFDEAHGTELKAAEVRCLRARADSQLQHAKTVMA